MALMKFRRSAVPAKVPSITDLALGEIAINTYDGKLFLKKDNGTQSIVEIGAGGGGGGSGTVTSVAASGGTTGLTFTGSPITTSGTLTLGGTLAIANGGTGATTAAGARTALGLGTAATTDATAYATAAQGAKADTAVQTIASTDGSVTITGTTAIDLSVAVAGSTSNVLLPVRNITGATLTKGTAVYISGATGQISTVSKAIATSDATSAQTLGLVTANIANNANGNVTLIGTITNINTSAYTDGQQLYLSPTTAGTLTATKPYAPDHLVYMAVVEHAHPTQGKLFVKVQNGYEMDELHDVSAQNPANNDGLFYNTTSGLWEKKSIATALGYTPYNATNPAGYTTNVGTVTSVSGTGTVSGLTLTGSVTSSGSLTLGGTLSLTSGNVTTALGYTPYNATNPSGYLSTVSLTSNVTGVLPVANGGTGITSVGAAGNVLTSDGTAWVSQLPASGGMTYTAVKTANFTASANTGVQTNTSGGAFTVTLPASPAVGAQVVVVDSANSWATNNLTIARNGSTIEGVAEDLVCNISSVSVQFVYNGTTWDVFAQVGGANGASMVYPAAGIAVSTGTAWTTSLTAPSGALVGTTATQTLTAKTLGNYTETIFAVVDAAGAVLDPNNGPIQTWTLGANRTPSQANWAAGQSITLMIDDGTAYAITWTTLSVVWVTDAGVAPTLKTTGFTTIVLWKVGTTIYGARVGNA